MKKVIAFLLGIVTILFFATIANAAEYKPGDTVNVEIRLNTGGLGSTKGKITWDSSLEYQSAQKGSLFDTNTFTKTGDYSGNFGGYGETAGKAGVAVTLTFKIKDNTKSGMYRVYASDGGSYDMNVNKVSASYSGGSITVVSACNHDKTTARVIKEATPTEAGEKQFVCDNCGQIVKTEIIPALGPGQTDPQPEAPCTHEKTTAKESKAATCTDAGERQFVCNKCSKVVKTETIPALGHDSGKWTVAKKPTATAEGLRELRCTRCGKVLASEIIPIITAEMRYNQSVSSLGIRFRDIAPELTSKWYMFTPLDLSQNGTQEIPLLAANVNVVGQATVTVQDGFLTVNYKMSPLVEMVDMAFTVLPDLSSVDTVEPEMERFAFGEPISIADDLGGDGRVLLYVLGHVNYDFADQRIEKHSPSSTRYMKLVESLKELMD